MNNDRIIMFEANKIHRIGISNKNAYGALKPVAYIDYEAEATKENSANYPVRLRIGQGKEQNTVNVFIQSNNFYNPKFRTSYKYEFPQFKNGKYYDDVYAHYMSIDNSAYFISKGIFQESELFRLSAYVSNSRIFPSINEIICRYIYYGVNSEIKNKKLFDRWIDKNISLLISINDIDIVIRQNSNTKQYGIFLRGFKRPCYIVSFDNFEKVEQIIIRKFS